MSKGLLVNNILMNKRAMDSIAHGALTNSKRPESFVKGVYPTHAKMAYGCRLIDVDDNQYIDFICGLGTNYFGYRNPEVRAAVNHVLEIGGPTYSLGSSYEVLYAERVKEVFPFLDRVRFLKTGSEGCSAAVRIARAFTGRSMILSDGYHGWHDEFTQLTQPANGVAQIGWNRKLSESVINAECAAVIIEPIITDFSPERRAFLEKLRENCTKNGVILIFDETITAYRFPENSVARHLNILPDLWVGGKALAGGLPLSVVGGRADVMECDYFVSSTWAGDNLALAASNVCIDMIHGDYKPSDLWIFGQEFMERFNAISPDVQLVGYPTRGIYKYKNELFKALFMQECCLAGILIGPSWFYNRYLHEEINNVISITRAVIKKINNGKCRLQGELPRSPFAQKVRD